MGLGKSAIEALLEAAEKQGVQGGEKAASSGLEKASLEGADDFLRMNPSLSKDVDPELLNKINQQGVTSTFDRLPPRSPADLSAETFEQNAPQAIENSTPILPKGSTRQADLESAYSNYSEPVRNAQSSADVLKNAPMTPEEQLAFLRGGKSSNMSMSKPEAPPIPEGSLGETPVPEAGGSIDPKLAGAGAAAGVAGLAMMPGSPQNKTVSDQPIGTGGLTDLPGFPSSDQRKFNQDNILLTPAKAVDQTQEQETPVPTDQPKKAGIGGKGRKSEEDDSDDEKSTDKKSDTQALADILQAKNPEGEESFADAQNHKNMAILANQLGSAGDIFGGALARTGPNAAAQAAFKNNIGIAEGITKDYQERKAMEEQDPNSAVSKNYREFLQRYGVNAGPGVTAAQVKAVLLPAAEKDQLKKSQLDAQKFSAEQGRLSREAIADENRKSREFIAQENRQGREALRSTSQADKLEKDNKSRIDKANKLITAEVGSSRSAFGRAANTYQAAERIEQLVAGTDPNNLDKRQIVEIARNLDGMLSNGQPTISGMEKLIPKSSQGDFSKILEYVQNIPKGAQQGAFVNRMLATVAREKNLSHTQMQRTQSKLLGSYADLKDHPNMQSTLRMQNLPADIFDEPITLSTAEKKQTLDFAMKNNMPYDKAEQLIIKRKKQMKQQNADQ
jgi:hypothetical protein